MLEVAARISGQASLADVLDALFTALADLVPYDRIEYARLDDEATTLTTAWVQARYAPVAVGVGFTYRLAGSPRREDHPFVTSDLAASGDLPEHHPLRLLWDEGIRSELCVPLEVEGRRAGYLFFGSRSPSAYHDFHVWAMSLTAGVAAGAIAMAELRDRLAERNRELEELSRFRTRYLATISHELRTPLTGVIGLALALQEGLPGFAPEEVAELVGLVADQSRDAAAIVEDLLILTRSEAGELDVRSVPLDLAAEARAAIDSLGLDVAVSGAGRGLGDSVRVRQVVRNLLTNALRYGGSRVWVEVLENGKGRAEIAVLDDGPGIDEPDRITMFEPFGRGRQRPHAGSVGLGLWVCRQLAERMGGGLEYAHTGGASRFSLHLPAAP
jgi:signal transduction histidine kinase